MAKLGYGPEISYGESEESEGAHSPQKHCAVCLCSVPGYGTRIVVLTIVL